MMAWMREEVVVGNLSKQIKEWSEAGMNSSSYTNCTLLHNSALHGIQ